MKFNGKLIIIAICALSIVLVGSTIAVAQEEEGKIAITGTVEQTDTGFVIMGDDGEDYYVAGKDLSAMIGLVKT